MCDHTVGYLNRFITLSELAEILNDVADDYNRYNKTMNSLAIRSGKELNEDHKATDFLDGRRGFMDIFKHCPNCGERIDWKAIKKTI